MDDDRFAMLAVACIESILRALKQALTQSTPAESDHVDESSQLC